jgi:hypothetical protein
MQKRSSRGLCWSIIGRSPSHYLRPKRWLSDTFETINSGLELLNNYRVGLFFPLIRFNDRSTLKHRRSLILQDSGKLLKNTRRSPRFVQTMFWRFLHLLRHWSVWRRMLFPDSGAANLHERKSLLAHLLAANSVLTATNSRSRQAHFPRVLQ